MHLLFIGSVSPPFPWLAIPPWISPSPVNTHRCFVVSPRVHAFFGCWTCLLQHPASQTILRSISTYSLKISLILHSIVASDGLVTDVAQYVSLAILTPTFSISNPFKPFLAIFYHYSTSRDCRELILRLSLRHPLLAVVCYHPRL